MLRSYCSNCDFQKVFFSQLVFALINIIGLTEQELILPMTAQTFLYSPTNTVKVVKQEKLIQILASSVFFFFFFLYI